MEKYTVLRNFIAFTMIGSAALLGYNGWSEHQEANSTLNSFQELPANIVTIPIIEEKTKQSTNGSLKFIGAIGLGSIGLRLKLRQ